MPAVATETTPAVPLRRPVMLAIERFEVKRLVEEAVVEKKLVVVPLVPVKVARVERPRAVKRPAERFAESLLVEDAVVLKMVVPVALV